MVIFGAFDGAKSYGKIPRGHGPRWHDLFHRRAHQAKLVFVESRFLGFFGSVLCFSVSGSFFLNGVNKTRYEQAELDL